MLKRLFLLVMGLLVFGVSPISVSEVFGETVKFGALWELTGTGASWGIPCRKAIEFQALEINKKGGINVAGKKYLVEFITEDSKCTAADGVTAVKKLIFRDKVKFIAGPVCSATCAAIKPYVEENKVLMMTVSCGTDKWMDPQTKYTFRTYPSGFWLFPAFLDWAIDKRKDIKKVAFFNANDEAGKSVPRLAVPKLAEIEKKHPGRYRIVPETYYERGIEDFRPLLTRVIMEVPDIIGGSFPPNDAALIFKQSRELGYKGTFFNVGGMNVSYIVPIAGKESCEGVMGFGQDWECTPQMKKFYDDYTAYYGEPPLEIAGQPLDGLPLMVRAIEEAGSFDPDKVVKVLESWKTVKTYYGDAYWGGLKTYGVKHQLCRPWHLTMIRDGKSVVIASPMADIP